jgi:hypothetical protein
MDPKLNAPEPRNRKTELNAPERKQIDPEIEKLMIYTVNNNQLIARGWCTYRRIGLPYLKYIFLVINNFIIIKTY